MKTISLRILFLLIIFSLTTLAQTYYVTESGKKFHNKSCRFVQGSGIPIDLKVAIGKGLAPCSICKPGGESLSHDYYQWKASQDTVGQVSEEKTKVEKKRCKGITQKGKQCKNKAAEGSNYCWQHTK